MNKHVERALHVFEHRPKLAAKELLSAIAEDPDNAYLHAFLGLCLMNAGDRDGAFREAREAIRLDPEHPFAFYALSKCHYDQNNMLEAEVAIDEALRLEPQNASYWGLLSNIEMQNNNLEKALKAAENGLDMDPEDVHCHNLKALIQTRLGNKEEAKHSLDTAMAADPENALTHAYRGWALIEHNNHAESIRHFREALRIDPSLEWARLGLVKALQLRHWAFQMQLKLQRGGALAIVALFAALFCWLEFGAKAPPGTLTQLAHILKVACLVSIVFFILMPFLPHKVLSDPFMRFLLLFDEDGRLAMTRDERIFNVHLMAFLTAGAIGLVYAVTMSSLWVLSVIVFLYFMTVPLTMTEEKRDKKLWLSMAGCAVVFAGLVLLFTMPQIGLGTLRTLAVVNLVKVMASAGGVKAILGAIGLGATAAAIKEKEKKKIREQMLNQQNSSGAKAK